MARRVTSRVTRNGGSRDPERDRSRVTSRVSERDYLAGLNAERDAWVKAVGTSGWQRELDRRRAERVARHRARRHQAAVSLLISELGGTVIGTETLDETEGQTYGQAA